MQIGCALGADGWWRRVGERGGQCDLLTPALPMLWLADKCCAYTNPMPTTPNPTLVFCGPPTMLCACMHAPPPHPFHPCTVLQPSTTACTHCCLQREIAACRGQHALCMHHPHSCPPTPAMPHTIPLLPPPTGCIHYVCCCVCCCSCCWCRPSKLPLLLLLLPLLLLPLLNCDCARTHPAPLPPCPVAGVESQGEGCVHLE